MMTRAAIRAGAGDLDGQSSMHVGSSSLAISSLRLLFSFCLPLYSLSALQPGITQFRPAVMSDWFGFEDSVYWRRNALGSIAARLVESGFCGIKQCRISCARSSIAYPRLKPTHCIESQYLFEIGRPGARGSVEQRCTAARSFLRG